MTTNPENNSPSLRAQLSRALIAAEAHDPDSVEAQTLRLVQCAMSDRDVVARGRGECSGCIDGEIIDLLKTMAAQREVSAEEYDDAGRIADAERERQELDIILGFLPQPLRGDDLKTAVSEVVEELDAHKLKDVGRCMTALRQKYPGRIECSSAGKAVRQALL